MRQQAVPYIGHLLTSEGLKPDPSKVAAVRAMPTPKNKDDVKRFLGFFIYLAKLIPNLTELDAPLRELLKIDVVEQETIALRNPFEQDTITLRNPFM